MGTLRWHSICSLAMAVLLCLVIVAGLTGCEPAGSATLRIKNDATSTILQITATRECDPPGWLSVLFPLGFVWTIVSEAGRGEPAVWSDLVAPGTTIEMQVPAPGTYDFGVMWPDGYDSYYDGVILDDGQTKDLQVTESSY